MVVSIFLANSLYSLDLVSSMVLSSTRQFMMSSDNISLSLAMLEDGTRAAEEEPEDPGEGGAD
eukprot:Nk52_evm1s265 gene=Nk52_evmTU1s265